MSLRRRRCIVSALSCAVALSILGSPPAAAADPLEYVALGASFSAGVGVPPAAANSPGGCGQSDVNFPRLVAKEAGYVLEDRSCGGDTTDALVESQFNALSKDTDLVTLMIGYNDGNVYSDSISSCAQAPSGSVQMLTCQMRNGSRFSDAIDDTGPKIKDAITGIKSRAPSATVVVLGYPAIFPQQGNCLGQNPYSVADTAYLNRIEVELNAMLREQATTEGVRFIDTYGPSVGHDSCKQPWTRWIEPYSNPRGASGLHPNAAGERALAYMVLATLLPRPIGSGFSSGSTQK